MKTPIHLHATASRAATLLARNPALFCKVVLGKLNTVRPLPSLPARRRVRNVIFEYDLADYRGTAPMYFGSYAPLVVEAMKRLLQPGDVFIDVGASIGYLSATAAGLVGTQGAVHCFEPVPAYFARLKRFADLNAQHSIWPNACAVGDTAGVCTIYITHEPGQSTLVAGYKATPQISAKLEVPVVRLDSYIENHAFDHPALIKIDVEGFEFAVLRGLEGYFRKLNHRPPIICEVAPRAYPLLGQSLADLARFMAVYGYSARDLIDGKTPVDLCTLNYVEDVLFIAEAN